jgi:hypothetical protein
MAERGRSRNRKNSARGRRSSLSLSNSSASPFANIVNNRELLANNDPKKLRIRIPPYQNIPPNVPSRPAAAPPPLPLPPPPRGLAAALPTPRLRRSRSRPPRPPPMPPAGMGGEGGENVSYPVVSHSFNSANSPPIGASSFGYTENQRRALEELRMREAIEYEEARLARLGKRGGSKKKVRTRRRSRR